jgi:hypothetical protein
MTYPPSSFELNDSDLPILSDESAAAILDFLHDLPFRFEAHYGGQIRRFLHQQRGPHLTPPPGLSISDDDVPF